MRYLAIAILYFLAIVQGIGFTNVPALSTFLTAFHGFGLTTAQYGSLFLPMIAGAVASSFFGGILAKRYSLKLLLLIAVLFNVVAMACLAGGQWKLHDIAFTYPLLMTAMTFLGLGFGAAITALNPFVVHFFPKRSSSALTALHSCLGIGTAIGPLLLNVFFDFNIWWGEPAVISLLYFFLFLLALILLPKDASLEEKGPGEAKTSRSMFGIFVLIAVLYGITETTFGNWANIFLHQEKRFNQIDANYALSTFWGCVTAGRILATLLSLKVPARSIFRFLPFFILGGIGLILIINSLSTAILAFGLAGIGCSAFLPLTINFGIKNLLSNPSFASGLLIAVYMFGYGIAAEGIGFLHKSEHLPFQSVYLWLGALVIILGTFCFLGTSKKHPNE